MGKFYCYLSQEYLSFDLLYITLANNRDKKAKCYLANVILCELFLKHLEQYFLSFRLSIYHCQFQGAFVKLDNSESLII